MANSPSPAPDRASRTGTDQALATGVVVFAAVMLIIGGVMDILRGSMALAKDDIFVTTPQYAFRFDLTQWGWILLVLGILAVLVGLGLFRAALWARVAGVVIAGLLMLASFLSVPYYPLWSVVLIALYAFVIWGLCTVRPPRPHG
ncbi:hypothetical protein ACFV5N_02995 [Streptomyces sp. NPDC059853]|uniref:DUF7144 family membrane protein n=1 Tax=Streptomyces sp. NPDC059853 TaxID=3346973 RepID=UPI00364DFEC0